MNHQRRWTIDKIKQRLTLIEPLVYWQKRPLPPFRYQPLDSPQAPPPLGPHVDDSNWPVIEPYTYWGAWQTDFVLRTTFDLPDEWRTTEHPLALYLPLGDAGDFSHPEALVYLNDTPLAGCDRHHQEVRLPDWSNLKDWTNLIVTLHGWTGLGGFVPREEPKEPTRLFMRPCALVQIHQPLRDFIATARIALETADLLDPNQPARGHLLNGLDTAFRQLDTREPLGSDTFYASIPTAHNALRQAIQQAGPPLDVTVVAAGHAHIDVAWLWTLAQTRHKTERSFRNVLHLMEQFPDYHFSQSQPYLYEIMRQEAPDLFAAIQEQVKNGRWEPLGGMWVEADCNVSGSEALARQFLLGRSYFRDHFGPDAEAPVLWLPDVFGYAWALPQLIKQAGLDYFMTIKIGWSQYNRLPYDSFWWQGLDGTRVLTHFSTSPDSRNLVSTYNAKATVRELLGTWHNFQQKEAQQELLMSYGYGDGGGGPTREMLENLREMAHFPALPQARQASVGEFFRNMEASSGDHLPTWNGELYLEMHRGTYTSQSRTKRHNRRSEFLLHDAEFLAVLAAWLDGSFAYPHEPLRRAWRLVCLNQFHDILPGSSIAPVYVDAERDYAEVAEIGTAVSQQALAIIQQQVGGDLLVINPTSFARQDLAFWPNLLPDGQQVQTANGRFLPTQATPDGTWIALGAIPPYSTIPLQLTPGTPPTLPSGLSAAPNRLENNLILIELNEAGDISRLYDKLQDRELLPPGAVANQLQAFEDRPLQWDAWDIDSYFEDRMDTAEPARRIEVIANGPLRATIEIERTIGRSPFVQRLSLSYNSPQLDIHTRIDWQERHTLLKVAFPLEVLAATATYEIQWGNVERPTHRNTSWDWARFETCAQKWVDLSEGNYGVSLLNDCKYGHDIKENVIRLSLLRSPTMPDPDADRGEHEFTYSLLPHAGGWGTATQAAAYGLNDPLIVASGDLSGFENLTGLGGSFLAPDRPNFIIETVKQAEDGNGIIVRGYESQRQRGPIVLETAVSLQAAWRTNLLEENEESLPVENNRVSLTIRPYEIVTLRLMPA